MVGHAQLRFGTSGHRLFTIAAPRDAGHDGIEVRGFGQPGVAIGTSDYWRRGPGKQSCLVGVIPGRDLA